MADQTTKMRGVKIALACYVVLLALQLAAYFMSHLVVLLAIAFETLASAIIAIILLFSAYYSLRPADEMHMFGYGRAQNIAALVSAVLFITYLALETFRQAISKLLQMQMVSPERGDVALAVSAVSLLVCLVPFAIILRVKGKTASVVAQLVSSLADMVSYAAAMVSTVLVNRGIPLADPVASMLVGVLITMAGIYLIRENVAYLLGKGPGREFIRRAESAAMSVEGVLNVHDFRAEYVGPDTVHSGFHIEVARGTSIEEANRILGLVRERVDRETGCKYCVIQIEPEGTSEHQH
jgi:cation diffusion facilitator family transporter